MLFRKKQPDVPSSPVERLSWVERVMTLPAVLYVVAPLSVLYEVYLEGAGEERLTRGGFEKAIDEILRARKREKKSEKSEKNEKNEKKKGVLWKGDELISEAMFHNKELMEDLHSRWHTLQAEKIPAFIPNFQEVEDLSGRGYICTVSSLAMELFLKELGMSEEKITPALWNFSMVFWCGSRVAQMISKTYRYLGRELGRNLTLEETQKLAILLEDLYDETPSMDLLGYSPRRFRELTEVEGIDTSGFPS